MKFYRKCEILQKNLHNRNCEIFTDFKLLVAAGISEEGYTNTSEIIDLSQPSELWNDMQQLPTMMDTPVTGFLNQSIPIVCGI